MHVAPIMALVARNSPVQAGESERVSHSVVSDSLQPHGLPPFTILCPWNSPGKNTSVGYHFLLQGSFPTLGSNLDLLHCLQIMFRLSHGETCASCQWPVFPDQALLL